jgi:hypothetical protein
LDGSKRTVETPHLVGHQIMRLRMCGIDRESQVDFISKEDFHQQRFEHGAVCVDFYSFESKRPRPLDEHS